MSDSEMVKPCGEQEAKKEQVRTMFDRIAFRYDLLNRVLSFGTDIRWRNRTAKIVGETRPEKILDVAAGTGDLAITIARRMPEAEVTGIDFSEQMLAVARKKVDKRRIGNLKELSVADAENLPFPDESFDAVTVGFGVRNFGDIPAGLSEFYRVLKPGGTVCVLEFAMPEGKIFGTLYHFYFRRWLPFLGGIVSGDQKAYRYLNRSVEHFPYDDQFVRLMADAGFDGIRQYPLTRGLAIIYSAVKR